MTDDDEKQFNDMIAEEYLENLDPQRKNRFAANMVMRHKLSNWYDKSLRKDELYLINSSKFQNAIDQAKKRLSQTGSLDDDDFVYSKQFDSEVDRVIHEMDLPDEWVEYVRNFIAHGEPPGDQVFYGDKYIEITRIDEEGQVWMRLKPGLRREDYVNAWKAISSYLGPAQKKSKPYTNQELNNKIYEARHEGLSYGMLAKQFFPGMDKEQAIDRIKKIVKRESQRRNSGDKTS